MAALTEERSTLELASAFSQPVEDYAGATVDATASFYKGALVCYDTNDNKIKPGETSTTLVALGRCEQTFAAGETDVPPITRCGIFRYENSASTDEIAQADVGNVCYVVDDQTVAKTDGTSTRSAAGKVYKVDSFGVYVVVKPAAF